ncbi:MAG: response regulator, partial [Verrucomicrobia bacterium]|nr:response regulator [Verrucomicrobiota bacterium]
AVDEAECCADALAKSEADPPDLLIMDVHLPEINGVETTRRILARHPGVKVIMLSGDTSAPVILAALRAGAAAYLSKQNPSEEVLRATW